MWSADFNIIDSKCRIKPEYKGLMESQTHHRLKVYDKKPEDKGLMESQPHHELKV
jgi:hypothetical protein